MDRSTVLFMQLLALCMHIGIDEVCELCCLVYKGVGGSHYQLLLAGGGY